MLTIKPVSPARTDVRHLIEQLDQYQSSLYPTESNHLDSIEELSKSSAFFIAAYSGSEICGIGSVKLIDDYGEITRAIMEKLESYLVEQAVTYARLETGIHQKEAIQLYEKLGYDRIDPFGQYIQDPLSVFMEKKLEYSQKTDDR